MGVKVIAKNKRAKFDYFLLETLEAGLMLTGTEIKSLRLGKASIVESHIGIKNSEVWAYNITIPHYEQGNRYNHNETRTRKLLLHKKQIEHLAHRMKTERLTIVPTSLYLKGSLAKLEIALGKGKKLHDKRQDQAKKDVERKLQRGNYEA